MIINKFVFPIKANKTFVSGALPQGYLTANDINKDMFYVISPSVGQTVITARFQNTLQTDEPELVKLVPSDEPINMLVNENASYYEVVKEWNVWQGVFPSKALEYVAFNRAGEIGISFSFSQRIIPKAPNISGVEYKGEIINKNFVPNVNGYWVVKLAEYEVYGVEYNYNDIITYFDGQAIKRSAITQSGNTFTVEYEVEPSVAGSDFEGVDPNITDLILQQLGEVTENIKFIKLKLGDFYTKDETYNRDEIDNLFEDVNLEIVDLKEDVLGLETDNTLIKERLDDVEDLASNNSGRLDDVELDITRIDIKDTQQDDKINEAETELLRLAQDKFDKIPLNNVPFLNALGKVDNRYLDVGEALDLFVIVPELPPIENAFENRIYLVPNVSLFDEQEVFNDFSEYFVFDNKWETLGSVGVDLEDYYTKEEINSINNILRTWVTDNFASKTEFNAHKDNKDNPHGVTAEQVDTYVKTEINSMLDNKVDKVEGKGLSANDFTNNDKNKLDGIEAGAEVNEVNSVNGKIGTVVIDADEIVYSVEKNVKEAIENLEVTIGNIDTILDSILGV